MENLFDYNNEHKPSNAKEIAEYYGKSLSWVYKHQDELGVMKLGGSLFFPKKEESYERLFCREKGVEMRFHPKRKQVHGSLVQNKERSQGSRSSKKKGTHKSCFNDEVRDDSNRHGIFGFGK